MAEDLSRRDVIENAMEAAMNDALEKVPEKTLDVAPVDNIAEEAALERNEKGQFASKEEAPEEAPEVPLSVAKDDAPAEEEGEQYDMDDMPVPSSWKKEYRVLFNKVKGGESLSQDEGRDLLNYINQRDTEYKRGVSTYRQEAERAKSLQEAINPFIPELQANNISPEAWINNLGRAHMMLAKAPQEQKIQIFQQLANEYGIQFPQGNSAIDYTYADGNQQLMQTIQSLQSELSQVKSWKDQEEDAKALIEIERISKDKANFPYFDDLRSDMRRLLGEGKANGLQDAYELAEKMNADVWQRKQEKLIAEATEKALKAQQVQKAKAASVSVKSVTPSGKINAPTKTDRRSILSDAVGDLLNNRI